MHPEQGPINLKFGGGVAESVFNPLVLALVLLAGILVLVCPRAKATVAFLVASLLIPTDQILVIGGLHFPMLRVLVLFGIARMLKERASSKRRLFCGGINRIDIGLIVLTTFIGLNGVLLFQEAGALINQVGNLLTVFGAYFLLRFLIRDEADVIYTIRAFAWIAAVIAVIMIYELSTGHNPYALLGGAQAANYGSLAARSDRFRAQGPFAHSILAGTFGAVLLPLFVALWWRGKKNRTTMVIGIAAATVMTFACNSSTPVIAYAAGVMALCLWPLRKSMRAIRWGIVLTLVSLHMVMKAPVWHLIARIDISGGSSSWHRYMLIDQCIRHFGDWWLIGVKDTSIWGWDMWDTANQYVALCDSSGLIPFLCFVAILVYGFKYLGRARRAAEDRKNALFIWAVGSALFANVVAFFGISYFDQTVIAWYALLAMIPAVIATRKKQNSGELPLEVPASGVVLVPQLNEQPAFLESYDAL
jgi:hypothetical protein